MTEPVDIRDAQLSRLRAEVSRLREGGGGGKSGGMDPWQTSVEKRLDELPAIRKDVGEIKVELATLKERIAHLPGKGFVFAVGVGTVAALVSLLLLLARMGLLQPVS